MAYAVKYSVEFKDVEDSIWLVYFSEDGWGGGITALTPGPNAVTVTWNQSDKYQTIIGSTVDIQLLYESAIDDLYTEESQDIKVGVIKSPSIYWEGFLSPGQYFRQFNKPVHFVTLTASDGLGELKEIKFHDVAGDPYFYSATEIVTIANILQNTGITATIYDAINIYEDGYDKTVADSPLEQTYIWPERYWDELTDNSASCYDVLVDILKKYGATIRYSDEHWYLLRPNDYSAHDKIYYRVYTYAGVYSSNSSFTSYNSIGASMFYIHADQEITRLPGVGSAEVTLEPGKRVNDLKNGSFDSFAWSATDVPYYWGHSSTVPNYDKTKVVDNLTLYTNEAATQPTLYLKSDTISYNNIKSIRLTLDYRCYYQLSPTHVKICVGIKVGTGRYYDPENDAWETTSWAAGTSNMVFDLLVAPARASSATTVSTLVVEPSTGPFTVNGEGVYGPPNYITIYLYELWNETTPGGVNNWLSYENVFLEIERDGVLPETQVYTFDAPNTITNIKKEHLNLGDSFMTEVDIIANDDLYYGITSDAPGDSGNETDAWSIKGHVAASEPIAELLARQLGEGYHRSLDLLRGSIRSTYTYIPHLAFEDSNFTDAYGFNKRYFPQGIALDVHRNEWSGEWAECAAIYTDEEMEWASHDCGGDATITGNSIEVDSWTTPGAGSGYFAYFDEYTAIAGETIRLVCTLTDDGSSANVNLFISGVNQNITWGTNYITYYAATAAAKTFQLHALADVTINATCVIDIYSITGI